MEEHKQHMSFGTAFIIGAGFALGATLVSIALYVIIGVILYFTVGASLIGPLFS